ncbi:MAG: MerR family transcriptional regulator [Siculibacillus sp.]
MTKPGGSLSVLAEILRPLVTFEPIDSAPNYSIGKLSSHLRVSLRTLRFYEQTGLLQPAREGIRRLYSPEDLERLEVIVALRELEVSLTGIKALLTIVDSGGPTVEERAKSQLDKLLGELEKTNVTRIRELETINRRIDQARKAATL